jgi:hypothetical protein
LVSWRCAAQFVCQCTVRGFDAGLFPLVGAPLALMDNIVHFSVVTTLQPKGGEWWSRTVSVVLCSSFADEQNQ